MRSGNPVLSDSTFLDLGSGTVLSRPADAMTLNGTIAKTGFLLFLTGYVAFLQDRFGWRLGRLRRIGKRSAYPLQRVCAQALTAPQKVQALANLGAVATLDAGNLDRDLAADYVTAKT